MNNRKEPDQQPEEHYTIADAETLNSIKNSLRDVTRTLDASTKVYPASLEASQVKHEISVLLSELRIRSLLPAEVTIDEEPNEEERRAERQVRR